MTAFATQSNIDMSGPGLLGSDVVGSSRRKSKRITIGTGLTLSGGALSNSLDLSGYVQKTSATGSLILPSGTTAERDGSPAAGYSRWNTTTSRFERWTGGIWENYVRLSGDTMTGALSLGSNGLTCGVLTASGKITTAAGTLAATAISPSGYVNSGIYWSGTNLVIANSGVANSQFAYLKSVLHPSYTIEWAASSALAGSGDLILGRAAAGLLAQRNGINAQCHLLSKSYTSDATQEALMLDAGKQISGKLGLYSYRGSSGGSNYPIQIGMLAADGTTFLGMTIATNGAVTAAGTLNYSDGTIDARTSMNHALTLRATGAANAIRVLDGSGATKWSVDSTGSMTIGTLGYLSFPHSTTVGDPNQIITGGGTGLGLRTSGSLSVATGGPVATFTVDATGKVTSTSQMTHVPPTSTITLSANGQFSVEMTSNTAGNLVYRGSDGTTRRMALLFA